MTVLEHEAPRGLRGVVVTDTELGDVRGLEGFYHYRQYAAVDLAERRSLEDVWYLLFEGGLPDPAQAEAFAAEVRGLRAVPAALPDAFGVSLLDGLRTAVSFLGAVEGFRPVLDLEVRERRRDA